MFWKQKWIRKTLVFASVSVLQERKCTVSIRDRRKDAIFLPLPNQSRSNQRYEVGEYAFTKRCRPIVSCGPVAPPIDHLRTFAWLHTGHCPLSPLYQLFEQLLQLLVLLASCVPAFVRWTCMRGVATMQIKLLFWSSTSSACLNVWCRVATFFPDSSCYYCVTMQSILLWWSRIKKNEWMNDIVFTTNVKTEKRY